jgi:hypothetical protein
MIKINDWMELSKKMGGVRAPAECQDTALIEIINQELAAMEARIIEVFKAKLKDQEQQIMYQFAAMKQAARNKKG